MEILIINYEIFYLIFNKIWEKHTSKFGLPNIIQANYNDQIERVINYNIGDFSKFQKSIEKKEDFSCQSFRNQLKCNEVLSLISNTLLLVYSLKLNKIFNQKKKEINQWDYIIFSLF